MDLVFSFPFYWLRRYYAFSWRENGAARPGIYCRALGMLYPLTYARLHLITAIMDAIGAKMNIDGAGP